MLILLLLSVPLFAQDTPLNPAGTQVGTEETPAAATNTDALRNAAQNPVASLISVPIQENFNFNTEPANRTQNVLNIQPVIPLSVSQNWNLIVRWIMPVVYQPLPVPQPLVPPVQTTGVYGLGDMNPTFFLVPKKSKIIWGVGPTFVLPTATTRKFSVPLTITPACGPYESNPPGHHGFGGENRIHGEIHQRHSLRPGMPYQLSKNRSQRLQDSRGRRIENGGGALRIHGRPNQ